RACADAQRALAAEPWPDGVTVGVRMGLHSGDAQPDGAGYTSLAVHEAARICAAAHGTQVLVSGTTAAAARADIGDLVLRDLGEFQLRDLDDPLRLFQLTGDGLREEFPAVRAVPRATHNVPQTFTSFVGRDDELQILDRALFAHRLVTLVGPGGVGKTRLAFELARRAAGDYAGGAWVVLLANVDADAALDAVTASTGTRDLAGRDQVDGIVERLEGDSKLLVLDNCEHVADVVSELVTQLMTRCPALHVLATSREPLRVAGEHTMRLEPLRLPDRTEHDPRRLQQSDAVRL